MRKSNNKDYDMYISYEKTSRGGRRGNKNWKPFLMVLIAIVLVITTVYLVNRQIDLEKYDKQDNVNEENNIDNQKEFTDASDPEEDNGEDQVVVDDEEDTQEEESLPQGDEDIEDIEEENISEPVKVKGLYITSSVANNKEKMNSLIEVAETTEINALVIDVKDDDGRITYDMDSEVAKSIGATTNAVSDMEGLVKELKEKGIYTIARIVAFKDPFMAENRHDLSIKNNDGSLYQDTNGEYWVNPYKREVWGYLIEISQHAADIGFDEIQYDYIRFSTGRGMSNVDFGEDSDTKTKEDIIIEFTKYAYETLKPLGIFVSADVYGAIISSSIDAGLVGQNYVEMAKHLDYICPMIYPSHYGDGNYGVDYPDLNPKLIVNRALVDSQEKLDEIPEGDHKAIVRPWLQDFTAAWLDNYMPYGAEEIREQIDGVYEAGYDEWLFWNASGNYTVDGFNEE